MKMISCCQTCLFHYHVPAPEIEQPELHLLKALERHLNICPGFSHVYARTGNSSLVSLWPHFHGIKILSILINPTLEFSALDTDNVLLTLKNSI